jgi:transposase-like protein
MKRINHVQEPAKKIHRRKTSKEERLAHVKRWQDSGLPVSDYCRQHNIPLTSFIGWRSTARKSEQAFKPVMIAPSLSTGKNSSGNVIEIISEQGIKIRLLNVMDATLVINIARGLTQCN